MMDDNAYQNNLMQDGPDDPKAKLTPVQKQNWNNFIDFLDKAGYKGSTELDNRNTNLGRELLAKYNAAYPKNQIQYEDVPQVQSALQEYRQALINNWKAGKSEGTPDIKTENDIMPGLSKIDGWLGSKTSSYKFPTAVLTHTDGTQQNFGVNTDLYDKLVQSKKQ